MILGGPSKAQNMIVIRPFSRQCEIVSIPATVPFGVSESGLSVHKGDITATGDVLIPDLFRIDHMEGVGCPFGGNIDMTILGERGGSNKKHVLFHDPFEERLGNLIVELGHRIVVAGTRLSRGITPPSIIYIYYSFLWQC